MHLPLTAARGRSVAPGQARPAKTARDAEIPDLQSAEIPATGAGGGT